MRAAVLLLLTMLFLLPASYAERQLLDQVVAVVNDDAITQSELDGLLRPLYEDYKQQFQDKKLADMMNEARGKLLNQLIEDRLVFQEAQNQKIQIEEKEVDQQMEEFKKRFSNETSLEDALRREGLTLNTMRERLHRQAMIRRMHDMEIRSKIVISPLEIESYYGAHPEEFSSEERLRVRSLTIKKNDEARQKGVTDEVAKAKIRDLREKILLGRSFEELAKQYSEDSTAKTGGLGDWISRGDMIAAIDDVVFKLKKGEISQVVETPLGYHLFRLEDLKENRKRTIQEAREEIFAKVFQEKARKRFGEWTSELKRNAYISIR